MSMVWLHLDKVPDEFINYGIAIEAVEKITDNEGCITIYYSYFY